MNCEELKRLINDYEDKNNLNKESLMGFNAILIFSKEVFPKNNDICKFLKDVYKIQYKEYVMKSRTLVVSKLMKFLNALTDDVVVNYFNALKEHTIVDEKKETMNAKNKATENLSKWIRGMNRNE